MNDATAINKALLSQLFAQWDSRADLYGDVEYGAALIRNGDTWKNIIAFFAPSRKQQAVQNCRADYGTFLIVRGTFPCPDAKDVLHKAIADGCLRLPDTPGAEIKVLIQPTLVQRRGAHQHRYPIQYAVQEYEFRDAESQRAVPPQGYICAPDQPLFPHIYAAIEDRLGIRMINQAEGQLIALVPDYRGSVQRVRLSGSSANITLHVGETEEDNIIGKLYFEDSQGLKHHHDIVFEDRSASVAMDGYPRKVIIVLLSRDRGDVIDEWFFDVTNAHNPGVEIEVEAADLETLIMQGESETLEFKSKVPTSIDLARAVSAFANSRTGRIVIGVSDEAEVIGSDANKLQDTLTNILRAHCEPVPSFSLVTTIIRDKAVHVINVPEGDEKPYLVREKGVYVRSGATTRHAGRNEIDRMYARRSEYGTSWR